MSPSEKYVEEKDELKAARMNRILAAAFELFSVKGIDTIAMTDIAKKAEIGVASLYRYYSTKDEIAIRTVIWAWNKQKERIIPLLYDDNYENLKGIDQIHKIQNMFINLYETQSDFLRFIYFFDSFAVRTEIEKKRLADYEKVIGSVQEIIAKAINKGLEDGSVNSKYKNCGDILYFTLMHTLFSMTQKLTLSGTMLNMDEIVGGKKELETLSNILITGIKG